MSHPTGSQFSRNAALAFLDAGILDEFWTGLSVNRDSTLFRLLPPSLQRELGKREFDPRLSPLTRTRSIRELGRQLLPRVGLRHLTRHEVGLFSTDGVYRDLDRRVARRLRARNFSAVYCYEDGALESLRAARQTGASALYELPIGHWRTMHRIMQEEAEREPEWAVTLDGLKDSREKLDRKDQELELAHTVIVPSPFVRDTLIGAPGDAFAKAQVVRYGAPPVTESEPPKREPMRLRALFVGQLGARKGVHYLLRAFANSSSSLTLIGPRRDGCEALDLGLAAHRYLPPMPHSEVLEEMRRHDVLVFPSLFEGQAQVMLEAMSQGLPVIATPNAGAEGIVVDGQNGFLVAPRSVDAIIESVEKLRADPEMLDGMSVEALATAKRCSWAEYRRALVATVQPEGVG